MHRFVSVLLLAGTLASCKSEAHLGLDATIEPSADAAVVAPTVDASPATGTCIMATSLMTIVARELGGKKILASVGTEYNCAQYGACYEHVAIFFDGTAQYQLFGGEHEVVRCASLPELPENTLRELKQTIEVMSLSSDREGSPTCDNHNEQANDFAVDNYRASINNQGGHLPLIFSMLSCKGYQGSLVVKDSLDTYLGMSPRLIWD